MRVGAGDHREVYDLLVRRHRGHGSVVLALPESVSYTHLRAHETVLDLVCRLLLEKKNTACVHGILSEVARVRTDQVSHVTSN